MDIQPPKKQHRHIDHKHKRQTTTYNDGIAIYGIVDDSSFLFSFSCWCFISDKQPPHATYPSHHALFARSRSLSSLWISSSLLPLLSLRSSWGTKTTSMQLRVLCACRCQLRAEILDPSAFYISALSLSQCRRGYRGGSK